MSTRRASQLTIAYAADWKQQNAWDVPLVNGDISRAFPATSRNYLDVEETTEDLLDCTGEDFLFEILTGQLARLTIDFDVDPDLLAGWVAFAKGVAQAPSGGTNEVQTETVTATGGTRALTVQIGANAQTTAEIAYNANAAAIQAALEALSNVGVGDIVVAGTGPYTYTFSVALQRQDVNQIVPQTHNLTGGTSSFATTTPGVGRSHNISRITGFTLPLMTLFVGFRDSDKQPVIFKNVVVDSVRTRASNRNRVTATVTLLGSADLVETVGYTMPACTDIVPIRFGDCQMSVAGVDYIAANQGREFEYYYQNDVIAQFDGASINSTRHERASVRPTGFNFWVLGEPGDNLYLQGKNKSTLPVFLRVGPAGRHVKFTAPQGLVKLAPTGHGVRFGGDPPESEIAIVVRPKKVAGDPTTPVVCVAVTSQQTTYLIPA